MRRFITISWLIAVFGGLAFGSGAAEQSEAAVLEEILALEKAALDMWYGESDPTIFAEQFADKATYFDPWALGRVEDGAITEYLMTFKGKIPNINYEIFDPRVDLYGDTAVVTFTADAIPVGEGPVGHWNVTDIFTRTEDGWEKIHANWSYRNPGP